MKRSESDQHQNNCIFAALQPTIQAMGQRMSEQETAIKHLKRKISLHEDGLLSMRETLAASCSGLPQFAVEADAHGSTMAVPAHRLSEAPPFESATHHLLSLHESLREELDRVSMAVTELDARSSVTIINESLRLKEEMAHTNAVITSMRANVQWLMSARLQQVPSRFTGASGSSPLPNFTSNTNGPLIATGTPNQPVRRLSDSARQDTKL